MSQRARCWICRLVLPQEYRAHVCTSCLGHYQGLCLDCLSRNKCSDIYRATVKIGRGELAPAYPPCLRIPPLTAYVPEYLSRAQRRDYGLPVGMAALILAGDGIGEQPSLAKEVSWEQVVALGEAWGARVRGVVA